MPFTRRGPLLLLGPLGVWMPASPVVQTIDLNAKAPTVTQTHRTKKDGALVLLRAESCPEYPELWQQKQQDQQ